MVKLKKNIPSTRKREIKEQAGRTKTQALMVRDSRKSAADKRLHSAYQQTIGAFSLRSAWKQPSTPRKIVELRSDDEHNTKNELDLTQFRHLSTSATPPYTPQRQSSRRHQQKQNLPVRAVEYPSPPDSRSSTGVQRVVTHHDPKRGISNFRATLAAAVPHFPVQSSNFDDGNDVRITGTQVNIKYRKPAHSWTPDERTALCLLMRFFSADLLSLTAVMNGLFPKVLVSFTSRMVDKQYFEIRAGKQCSAGTDAVWDAVWSIADFNMASRHFQLILEKAEETAGKIGAALTRRLTEDQRNFTYSNRRRDALKNRPVKRREVSNSEERIVGPSQVPMSQRARNGSMLCAASLQSEFQRQAIVSRQAFVSSVENDEIVQDEVEQDQEDVPTLLFRAFSGESAGLNSAQLFRAGQFIGRMNAVPIPPNSNDCRFAWDASNHLSQAGDIANQISTPFISLSPSLVWCVQRLYKMGGDDDSKKFAVINGPLVDAHTRLYKTWPILRQLKNTGMYSKAVRYKASKEFFAWAEIRQDAISTVISRNHLEMLSEASSAVNSVLRLNVLENTNSLSEARAEFNANPVYFDGRIGMAIGKICLLLGISFHSDQAVITETVFHILQGWAIKIDINDSESHHQAFSTFIGQLETSDCSVTLISAISIMRLKLRDAFFKGIQQAVQELLKDGSKRSNKKTRWNRANLYNRAFN